MAVCSGRVIRYETLPSEDVLTSTTSQQSLNSPSQQALLFYDDFVRDRDASSGSSVRHLRAARAHSHRFRSIGAVLSPKSRQSPPLHDHGVAVLAAKPASYAKPSSKIHDEQRPDRASTHVELAPFPDLDKHPNGRCSSRFLSWLSCQSGQSCQSCHNGVRLYRYSDLHPGKAILRLHVSAETLSIPELKLPTASCRSMLFTQPPCPVQVKVCTRGTLA